MEVIRVSTIFFNLFGKYIRRVWQLID